MKNVCCLLFVSLSLSLHGSTFYLLAPNGLENDKIFDITSEIFNRDGVARPFYAWREALRALGHDLKTTTFTEPLTDCAGLYVCGVPHTQLLFNAVHQIPAHKIVLLLFEPPTVASWYYKKELHTFCNKVFTMLDEYVDNNKYCKLYYPQPSLTYETPISFNEKKLCSMISTHKMSHHPQENYSARLQTIRFFEQYALNDFDLYGIGWDMQHYPSYKGKVVSKLATLQQYKFCICYENMHDVKGYVTEKIFDVMRAGCVPIYWGASNITDYVDADCFILRESFTSTAQLYNYIAAMTQAEYENYLQAITKYLASKKAQFFSTEYFVHMMISALLHEYDHTVVDACLACLP